MFESVNTRTDGRTDGRTHGRRLDGYTISSSCKPSAQVSQRKYFKKWRLTRQLSLRLTQVETVPKYLRTDSRFVLFHWGMNRITEAHIVWRATAAIQRYALRLFHSFPR